MSKTFVICDNCPYLDMQSYIYPVCTNQRGIGRVEKKYALVENITQLPNAPFWELKYPHYFRKRPIYIGEFCHNEEWLRANPQITLNKLIDIIEVSPKMVEIKPRYNSGGTLFPYKFSLATKQVWLDA